MSWSGVLPFWYYDLNYEHHLALCSCCFNQEWFSGESRVTPQHVVRMQRSFKKQELLENKVPDKYDSLL